MKKSEAETLESVKAWLESQLKSLIKIPAIEVDGEKIKARGTAMLTARLGNEYKKLISEGERSTSDDELLKILND